MHPEVRIDADEILVECTAVDRAEAEFQERNALATEVESLGERGVWDVGSPLRLENVECRKDALLTSSSRIRWILG